MTAQDLSAATRRTSRLTRTNTLLMTRNRLTLFYAVAMPVLPLGLLFLGERGEVTSAVATLSTVLLMALLFPVFYNLLSMFVTRRDELVLKRLRTGEVRDLELVTSMALPGIAITVLVTVIAVPVVMSTGLPFPLNPILLLGRGAGRRRLLRRVRIVDRGLDEDRRGGAAHQRSRDPARHRGPVRSGLPVLGAAVGRPAAGRGRA